MNMENKQHFDYFMAFFDVFVAMFILSYFRLFNLTFLRYFGLVMIQGVCVYKLYQSKIYWSKHLILLLLFLFLSSMLSLIHSQYFLESIIKTLTIIDLFVLSIILLPNCLRNYEISYVIKHIRNTLFFVLLFSFLLYRNDYSVSGDLTRVGQLVRLMAGFSHPNLLSVFSFLCFAFSFYLFIIYHKKKDIFVLLFSFFLIYKSGSRTAMYSIFIFLIFYVISALCQKEKFKKLFHIFLISIFLVFGLWFLFSEKNWLNYNYINQLFSYRLDYITDAIDVLRKNNALYTGMGAFRNSMLAATNSVMIDNGYFNYLYQFGLISFVCLLLFLGYCWFYLLRLKNAKNNKEILFFKSLFFSFLIYSFFENILLNISSLFSIVIYMFIMLLILKEEL